MKPTRELDIPERFPLWCKDPNKKPFLTKLSRLNLRHPILFEQQDRDGGSELFDADHAVNKALSPSRPRKDSVIPAPREIEFLDMEGDLNFRLLPSGALDFLLGKMRSLLDRFYQEGAYVSYVEAENWLAKAIGEYFLDRLEDYTGAIRVYIHERMTERRFLFGDLDMSGNFLLRWAVAATHYYRRSDYAKGKEFHTFALLGRIALRKCADLYYSNNKRLYYTYRPSFNSSDPEE